MTDAPEPQTWRHDDGRKVFHRRRKHVGEDYVVDTEMLDRAKADAGLICRSCHKLRPWAKLDATYDLIRKRFRRRSTGEIVTRIIAIRRVWSCADCGSMVKSEVFDLSTR